jgi:phosphoribosylanthranilate isomerase
VFQVVHFYRLARDCLAYLKTGDDVVGLVENLNSRRNINVVELKRVELYLRAILQMDHSRSVQLRHKTTLALN